MPRAFGIALDPAARHYRGGRVLVDGTLRRVILLTRAGRAALTTLQAGSGASVAERTLGRRLVDAGIAHPRPPRISATADVTVVMPVRDRTAALARCLTALGGGLAVVVVDDGSADPDRVAEVCRRHRATLIRREHSGGPAAARNTAIARVRTDLVAFVDSDCVPGPHWLAPLVAHFADPVVGAVAPRVRPAQPTGPAGVLQRFVAERSPIDLGALEGPVAPGTRLPYVPTAALVVRRSAFGRGFDVGLRHGEDVDLVWRLHDAGWRVRYEPAVLVRHTEPDSWRALLQRRWSYGTSAGPLSRRHPGRLAPLVLRPWPTAAACLLLARRPLPTLATTILYVARLRRQTGATGVPSWGVLLWAFEAIGQTTLAIGRAATALATPALLAALGPRRTRVLALSLLAPPALEQWVRRAPRLDPLRWALACIVDDAAYGLGVWWGSLREGTLAPLLPARGLTADQSATAAGRSPEPGMSANS